MNTPIQHLQAALGYLELGMHHDAWDELEALPPELRADDTVSELRISIYEAMEKWEPARVVAESLARRCPDNPRWWILWAYSLRREKSVADARAVLMEAAVIHPDFALIHYNLACYSCVEGAVPGATSLLKKAFSMNQDLRMTALDDRDLDPIFGGASAEGTPTLVPPHPTGYEPS